MSFDRTREHLRELLGVSPASETLRVYCERQAARVARWQGQETDSAAAFRKAAGGWEFTIDAGKVNTREKGWRDLKIAVAQKRPTAQPATPQQWESRELPEPTARVMWADITAAKRFRRSWHARLKRLGLPAMARLHVLGDGASWIWKAAGPHPDRVPSDAGHLPRQRAHRRGRQAALRRGHARGDRVPRTRP